jgi:hypothetical protein
MNREMMFGIPVITAANYLEVGAELGVTPWRRVTDAVAFEEYAQRDLSSVQRSELRFAPKNEAVVFEQPNGKAFTSFRTRRNNYAGTFVLLPGDFVVLTIDFMQGLETIIVGPACGVPSKADLQTTFPMQTCARREFQEETGLTLATIEPLTENPLVGVGVSGRNDTQLCYPFWGEVEQPVVRREQELDDTEHLVLVTMQLDEWLKFLRQGRNFNASSTTMTLLALMRMGMVG